MKAAMMVAGTLAIWTAGGCTLGTQYWPTDEELAAFEAAGPVEPELDRERLLANLPDIGPYRVAVGDLLEIRGTRTFLGLGKAGAVAPELLVVRVAADGTITVPPAGKTKVAGKQLGEIDAALVAALHPKYIEERPSIVVKVLEPRRVKVAILGVVENPGIHEVRHDQLTLYGALTAAGGIVKAVGAPVGARLIRIRRPGEDRAQAIVLPVKGLNIPYSDVALSGGETIDVERWEPDVFTVVGLVKKPGAYEFPQSASYNLMQALAIAGGVDRIADPPYATVFRKDAAGKVIPLTVSISGDGLVRASSLEIRPGDVVALEHTVGSWTRALAAEVLRLQFGVIYGSRKGL